MTNDNHNPNDNGNDNENGNGNDQSNGHGNDRGGPERRTDWREAIWSVPRPFVFAYFALVTGLGWPTLTYILWQTAPSVNAVWWQWPFELIIAAAPRGLVVGGGIAMYALFTVQGAAFLMVLYDYAINRWVKPVIKRHQDAGKEQGRQEADREWEEWADRKADAESRGLPFDEPRPNKTR